MEVEKQKDTWEEKMKKESVERLADITVAVISLKAAMSNIRNSCKLCGRCNLTKSTCDVAKSYKKIDKALEELETLRYNLENSIRQVELKPEL